MIALSRWWWHTNVLNHTVTVQSMTNLPWDMSSNRWYKCACQKDWF